jgi:hypothetical protein
LAGAPTPAGTFPSPSAFPHLFSRPARSRAAREAAMHNIIYLVGLIVIVMAILSLLGLR